MMPFKQAFELSSFYYNYQDTNVLINEVERLATKDVGRLREFAISLKDKTAGLLSNIGRLDRIDFIVSLIAGSIINDLDRLEKRNQE
ncbi:MAG: hypothetical protein K2H47_06905 [Muribaculaceae bacterium]|nr:hypothetical protein [Muribaculaceae bacterium]